MESMNSNDNESVPMSAVRRYYYDIIYGASFKDAVLSLDTLIQQLPYQTEYRLEDIVAGTYMPFEYEFDYDSQIAKEKLALLPLQIFSEELEESNCPTEHVRDWYDDVVGHVLMIAKDSHTDACYEYDGGSTAHQMCTKSTVCPKRYLEQHLSGAVTSHVFTSELHRTRPTRAFRIATQKLEVGAKRGIFTQDYARRAAGAYEHAFRKYHFDIGFSSSD
jgi:hypothetical protein